MQIVHCFRVDSKKKLVGQIGESFADLLQLVETTCNYTRKNLTTCSKSANKPSTSFVRTACCKL